MALKLEEHVVYVESLKSDMIPYSIVKEFLEQTIAEQEPALKKVDNTVNEANKEITKALNTLTDEITKLGKL